MNDFISKPLDVIKLIAAILRHTSARKETGPARNRPVQQALPQSPLAAIPGLDLRQALQRLGGDETMLWRLLRQLANENETVVQELRCLIARGQPREAAARLHTLIGGTGNLELALLAQLSSAAEAAILNGDMDRLSAHLDGLERHLSDFRRAVHELPSADEAKNGPSARVEQEQLDRLKSLLRDANLEAVELYERIAPAFTASLGEETAHTLMLAMEKFDFPRALQVFTEGRDGKGQNSSGLSEAELESQ